MGERKVRQWEQKGGSSAFPLEAACFFSDSSPWSLLTRTCSPGRTRRSPCVRPRHRLRLCPDAHLRGAAGAESWGGPRVFQGNTAWATGCNTQLGQSALRTRCQVPGVQLRRPSRPHCVGCHWERGERSTQRGWLVGRCTFPFPSMWVIFAGPLCCARTDSGKKGVLWLSCSICAGGGTGRGLGRG